MTMPKFEPVAEVLWYDPALRHTPEPAGKIIDGSMSFIESAAIGTQLYTAEQLAEAYEAGKLDAIPEPMTLPPLYPDESREEQFGLMNYARGWNACRAAMLAAAPKGEE